MLLIASSLGASRDALLPVWMRPESAFRMELSEFLRMNLSRLRVPFFCFFFLAGQVGEKIRDMCFAEHIDDAREKQHLSLHGWWGNSLCFFDRLMCQKIITQHSKNWKRGLFLAKKISFGSFSRGYYRTRKMCKEYM